MLKYYEPIGPYTALNSVNYPTLMNVERAMHIVMQAGINRCAGLRHIQWVPPDDGPTVWVGKPWGLLNGSGLPPVCVGNNLISTFDGLHRS